MPVLSKDISEECIFFVNSIITPLMPKKNIEPELFELVTSYQVHSCLSLDVNTQTGL